MKAKERLSTRCVHAGEMQDAQGSPHMPLYTSTTFKFKSTEDLLNVVEGRIQGNLYTRFGSNPTIRTLEEKLAALENAEAALAFCSGQPRRLCFSRMAAKESSASEMHMAVLWSSFPNNYRCWVSRPIFCWEANLTCCLPFWIAE